MKLTYLGTAAAEGFPAVFCNCEYCRKARKLGGKNIRTRSQALINDELIVDFPPDTYYHFLKHKIEADAIKYMIITHAHCDHFYIDDFSMRHAPFSHAMRAESLKVVCTKTAYDSFNEEHANVEPILIEPYQTLELGKYKITALPARHMLNAVAVYYIISDGEKTLLYANDTGEFYDESYEFIEKGGFHFDLVSFDCTICWRDTNITNGHMGMPANKRVYDKLKSIGAVNDDTVVYVNHFSHNGNPLHSVMSKEAKKYGFLSSYDGCEVVF